MIRVMDGAGREAEGYTVLGAARKLWPLAVEITEGRIVRSGKRRGREALGRLAKISGVEEPERDVLESLSVLADKVEWAVKSGQEPWLVCQLRQERAELVREALKFGIVQRDIAEAARVSASAVSRCKYRAIENDNRKRERSNKEQYV